MRSSVQRSSSATQSAATVVPTCSQLSITNSVGSEEMARATSARASRSCDGAPMAPSTVGATSSAAPTGARSTNQQRSGYSLASSRATSTASRVLPTPGGPTTVVSGCSRTEASRTRRSGYRPMNVLSGRGSTPSSSPRAGPRHRRLGGGHRASCSAPCPQCRVATAGHDRRATAYPLDSSNDRQPRSARDLCPGSMPTSRPPGMLITTCLATSSRTTDDRSASSRCQRRASQS